MGVLSEAGAETGVPLIEAWNKWDLLEPDERAMRLDLVAIQPRNRPAVPISAVTGEGLDALFAAVAKVLTGQAKRYDFVIGAGDGQRLA